MAWNFRLDKSQIGYHHYLVVLIGFELIYCELFIFDCRVWAPDIAFDGNGSSTN